MTSNKRFTHVAIGGYKPDEVIAYINKITNRYEKIIFALKNNLKQTKSQLLAEKNKTELLTCKLDELTKFIEQLNNKNDIAKPQFDLSDKYHTVLSSSENFNIDVEAQNNLLNTNLKSNSIISEFKNLRLHTDSIINIKADLFKKQNS